MTSISGALLSARLTPEADEIRVANNQTYSNQRLTTGGQAVTIRGGYDNCADTSASSSGTTLNGGFGVAVITVDNTGGSTRPTVNLVNLTLTDGDGGGLEVLGNIVVVVENSAVQFNDPARGIEVRDGANVKLRAGSLVDNNGLGGGSGVSGGGIFCDRSLLDVEDAHIFNNVAALGGGIYGTNGCQITVARTENILFGSPGGIFQNDAGLGGGIYLDGGADLRTLPTFGQTVIHDNHASAGGALYLTGAGTTAQLHDTAIVDNEATSRGGGLYLTDHAGLIMRRRTLGASCSLGMRCSLLARNRLTGTSVDDGGAGLFVGGVATAALQQTLVEANVFNVGPAGMVDGGGEIDLEGSVVAKNVGWNAFQVYDGTLELKFVSAVDNHATEPTTVTALYDMAADGAQVHVFSSAIDNLAQGSCVGSCSSSHTMDCVVSPTNSTLYDGTITNYVRDSPRFRDVARGNYHLRPDSPAIDLCSGSLASPTPGVGDVDRDARPVDLPTIANEDGPHDAGADEVTAAELLLIFSDGFELRNTSAWGGAAP
ncbi:MAG TPA: hypothetical protein VGV61_03375 [Thermoanaerobaculia bacterium]|jgi:hypothetical protein|nr:hypothetical protein [Thermoanaerobaculia bacterium]